MVEVKKVEFDSKGKVTNKQPDSGNFYIAKDCSNNERVLVFIPFHYDEHVTFFHKDKSVLTGSRQCFENWFKIIKNVTEKVSIIVED